MYHTIEFRLTGQAKVEAPGSLQLKQLLIQRGTRVRVGVRPYVVESADGPVEVADLLLEDGSVARAVRFSSFSFLDE